jgi:drug/metabolite transporter (DMT)-like permease
MPQTPTQLRTMPLAGPLLMSAAALMFAVLDGLIKMIGPSFGVWDIAFYRFGCGLAILIAATGWRGRNFLMGHNRRLLIIRGITGSIAFLSLVTAIRHIPLSTTMVLFYSFPAFSAFFSRLLFKEGISKSEVLCILVALGGVTAFFELKIGSVILGHFMAVLGGIFAGLTVSIIRKLRADNGPVIIYLYLCILGTMISLPAFIADPKIPTAKIEWLMVGGVAGTSILAQLLMNQGLRYCKSWEGGLYLMAELIFASLLGILFFSEHVSWRFWVGGLLILGSAVGLNRIRARSNVVSGR